MSSSPPFSFSGMLKLAFQNVLSNLNPSNSRPPTYQTKSLITMPLSSSNFVTKIRCFNFIASPNRNTDCLPLYISAIEIETPRPTATNNSSSLSKTIMNLAALVMFQTVSLLPIVRAAMVIAFAASFSEIFLKNCYPRLARVSDKIAFISFALGFFWMIGELLSGIFLWMGWLAWALSMLTITIASLHERLRSLT